MRAVSIDGNASDPLTGREHIAGYRIAADQSAGHPRDRRAARKPQDALGGAARSAAFWKKNPALRRGAPVEARSGGASGRSSPMARPRVLSGPGFHKPLN